MRRSGSLSDALRGLDLARSALPPEIVALTGGDPPAAEASEASEAIDAPLAAGPRVRFDVRAQESFGREMELLRAFLRSQSEAGIRILVLCDNPGQRDHLRDLIGEEAGSAEIAQNSMNGSP